MKVDLQRSRESMHATLDGAAILVVEDDPLVAAYISEVLLEARFSVVGTASSGEEALSLVTPETELALVDISLAGRMDGVEVARRLLARHDVGVVFLTGSGDPLVQARAAGVGAYAFLTKPFLPSQAYNTIRQALKARRLGDQPEVLPLSA